MQAARTSCLVCLRSVFLVGFIVATGIAGCNSIIGLDQFSIAGGAGGSVAAGSAGDKGVTGTGGLGGSAGAGGLPNDAGEEPRVVDCHFNKECTDRATAAAVARAAEGGSDGASEGGGGPVGVVPAVCVQPEGKCVELLTADCKTITGDYLSDSAIILGSLFSTVGAQAATNTQRQQSATLAIEQINDPAVGGVPGPGGKNRPLVMLSCDEAATGALTRAGTHLVNELHVPAIVGPNTSQDTLDMTQRISKAGGTVLMTPSAVASSIEALDDDDLTWLMAPSDEQRAPLMIQQINALETDLIAARGNRPIKLGIIYRNDALGKGTQTALNTLTLNGKPFGDPINLNNNILVDPYDFTAPNQDAIVAKYVTFAPDLLVLAGTAEAITRVMNPIEAQWNAEAGADRPYYVLIDSLKVPELLTAAANVNLRGRVRGTGIKPTADSASVFLAFKLAYEGRYMMTLTASSTGPSYDAAYAIAYALAATKDLPVSGANIAAGLRMLAGGPTTIPVGAIKALDAFSRLGAGEKITAVGTFAPLEWNLKGAVVGATIEMWCIGFPANKVDYLSSGLTYDLTTKQYQGTYTQCP